jgi:plasmid stabilization system protein ParE
VTFRVIVQPRAAEDLKAAAIWIARDSQERAQVWLEGIAKAILALQSFPNRCALAPENDAFEFEIRQLIHGQYRVLFTVSAQTEEVLVLHIRHTARRPVSSDDLR